MRLLTVILSVYVLLLAVVPCPCSAAAEHHAVSAGTAELSSCTSSDDADIDLCTPFCVVSSCTHAPMLLVQRVCQTALLATAGREKADTDYVEDTVILFHGSIWHPPMLRV